MSQVTVLESDLSTNPCCPHGPTILFSRSTGGKNLTKFYACAACRDRKACAFYLDAAEEDNLSTANRDHWKKENDNFVKNTNHTKLFIVYNKVLQMHKSQRRFCCTCNTFILKPGNNHENHEITTDIDDHLLHHPTKMLVALDNPRKEAQFLFSKLAVTTIVDILSNLQLRNVICMGTPRIHEHITGERPSMTSILLDFDKRYHSFFGPLQFCWYNMFNNHFFLPQSQEIFKDFLKADRGEGIVLVVDPPFGGRVELLAQTIRSLNKMYNDSNNCNRMLLVLWAFPYFMEPQILNHLPEFTMLDYKVDYDNHPLFTDSPKGRKLGSPVRLFTNLNPSTIEFPTDQGYKHCNLCNRWVSNENRHCQKCNACTSKDGRTYVHCDQCQRCVKPTWKHCSKCKRCAQPDHTCQELPFIQSCFHCKEIGHKKRQCPKVDHEELHTKRRQNIKLENTKRKRI